MRTTVQMVKEFGPSEKSIYGLSFLQHTSIFDDKSRSTKKHDKTAALVG